MIAKIGASDSFGSLAADNGGMLSRIITRDQGWTKAASEAFDKAAVELHRPTSDKYAMIHFVAIGANERYGFNRNGDAFTRDELRNHHDTFVKHAYLFREHRNHDPKLAIGIIKASAYNLPMDRVELLVWLDRDKAEKEYEKAANGEELSGSMACKIAFDICSICKKASKRVADYCSHAKHHMTKWLPQFRKYAYVFNPKPRYIDYSVVERPADRIAHYIQYRFGDGLAKAASGDLVVNGSDWAEFYGMEDSNPDLGDAFLRLSKAAAEILDPASVMVVTPKAAFIRDVLPVSRGEDLTDREIDDLRRLRPSSLWHQLAKRAAVLPFRTFAAYLTGHKMASIAGDPEWEAARAAVLLAPARLCSHTEVGVDLLKMAGSQFEPGCETDADMDPEHDDKIDSILWKVDEDFTTSEPVLRRKLIKQKVASQPAVTGVLNDRSEAALYLDAYMVYKVAALAAIESIHGRNEARELVIANLA